MQENLELRKTEIENKIVELSRLDANANYYEISKLNQELKSLTPLTEEEVERIVNDIL